MFCKSLRYVLQKILKSVLKTCWKDFCKTTRKLSAKILKGVFCKNTDTSSAKALRIVLQKYGEVLCRNTEGYSTKVLNAVIKNFWGEFQPQNNWLVKTQVLGLFPVTPWPKFLVLIQTRKRWYKKQARTKDGLGEGTILSDDPSSTILFFLGKILSLI